MRHLVLVVSLMLLVVPARIGADAQIAEWIGDYAMNHDGHRGTLTIADSKADCAGSAWCHLVASYTGTDGVRHPARIRQIDQAHQHMVLEISFPGNRQRFDAYLMSWDKTAIAGTTVWGQRTFGFYAIKRSRIGRGEVLTDRPELHRPERPAETSQPQSSPASATILPDGSIQLTMPDGSKRLARPGACGWTTVAPDGKKNVSTCFQVQPATPPVPEGASATWLAAHSDSLLNVARDLLGGDAASIDNYLKTAESGQPGIYDRIRLRTDLISKLTAQ